MAEVLKKVNRPDMVECPSFKNRNGWKKMSPDEYKISVTNRQRDFYQVQPKKVDLKHLESSTNISTYR